MGRLPTIAVEMFMYMYQLSAYVLGEKRREGQGEKG